MPYTIEVKDNAVEGSIIQDFDRSKIDIVQINEVDCIQHGEEFTLMYPIKDSSLGYQSIRALPVHTFQTEEISWDSLPFVASPENMQQLIDYLSPLLHAEELKMIHHLAFIELKTIYVLEQPTVFIDTPGRLVRMTGAEAFSGHLMGPQ